MPSYTDNPTEIADMVIKARALTEAKRQHTRTTIKAIRLLNTWRFDQETITKHDAYHALVKAFGEALGIKHPRAVNRWLQACGLKDTTATTNRDKLADKHGEENVPKF